MIEVGDKVKIRRFKNLSWGLHGGTEKKFFGKVGVVTKIYEVTPSKRVPSGTMVTVHFRMYNFKSGKIGRNHSFPLQCIDKLEKPASL